MADAELEQAAKDKAALATMRGATKAMEAVLDRNRVLEAALRKAGDDLRSAKRYVGESAYVPVGNSTQRVIDRLEEQAQAALKHVS